MGHPIEIMPLIRPYGLHAGNSRTAKVIYKRQPLADCQVEVEFFNHDGKRKALGDVYVAQSVKTDQTAYSPGPCLGRAGGVSPP